MGAWFTVPRKWWGGTTQMNCRHLSTIFHFSPQPEFIPHPPGGGSLKNIYQCTGTIFKRCQLSRWHFSRRHLSQRHLSISGISQLLLTQFLPNFKGRLLGPFLTDANCHGDICPGNICPGDICPYQEYLSCYCFGPNKLFWPLNLWDLKFFLTNTFFGQNFLDQKIFENNFFDPIYFGPKICRKQNFSNPIFFGPKIIMT